MALGSIDDIRKVNQLCDSLLASHSTFLSRKNIPAKRELIQVIKVDLDKLAHALLEVKEGQAGPVLADFFGDSLGDLAGIGGRVADQRIYHLGFEIHEPLDLVLFGIDHWIEQAKRALGVRMRVKEFHRFPASPAFQGRVGAYAEIMRIWIELNEQVLMLELFDIHRPVSAEITAGLVEITHRSFDGLFLDPTPGHRERMARLFGADEIWHYAFYVKSPQDVVELQCAFQGLAERDSSYHVAYPAPVHNPHDRSYHTKVIHQTQGIPRRMELEFVTEYGIA